MIRHIAGATNFGPDALSRYPGCVGTDGSGGPRDLRNVGDGLPPPVPDVKGGALCGFEEAVIANASVWGMKLVTWEAVRTAGVSDPEYAALLHEMGADNKEWPAVVSQYARFRNGLSNVDGVAMYKGRVVIPSELRGRVLVLAVTPGTSGCHVDDPSCWCACLVARFGTRLGSGSGPVHCLQEECSVSAGCTFQASSLPGLPFPDGSE